MSERKSHLFTQLLATGETPVAGNCSIPHKHDCVTVCYCRALGLDATFNVSEDGEGEQANPNSTPFAKLMDGKNT